MSLADVSIKRPTFITCIVLVMLAVGGLSMSRLGIDLFPDVTFPVVTVTTPYPGAGPSEIENLVTKPLEDEISTISGLKRMTSNSLEGTSRVIAEFTLETDVKYAEQQIRDRVSGAKSKLPLDIKEPVIRRIDPSDQPVLILAVDGNLSEAKLFDVADEWIRPKLQSVGQVGLVEILGGRKREIQVALDRRKLKGREVSASQVAQRIGAAGENVPAGKINEQKNETVFRTLGEFKDPQEIGSTIVSFFGSEVPTTVSQLGVVNDTLTDETSRTFVNGKKSLFLYVYRQSGANTIAVVDALKKQIDKLNTELANAEGKPTITPVRDGSWWIHVNVDDVKESIMMGVVLAVLVVFLFLANGRSTIITGLALPNSLIGAFILMAAAGFTINIMTLLALSLSVGLLIDDAIVVRENIFRHIELGKSSKEAALVGTAEVRLAVIATTLTVIAVFGPVGFLKGVVGQFFKQFGLTICFAMMISLFDALTIAPMLSAYFAGKSAEHGSPLWDNTVGIPLRAFSRFQDWLERAYGKTLKVVLRRPLLTLLAAVGVFLGTMSLGKYVAQTFLPAQDAGEFTVALDLPPGANLETMSQVSKRADELMRKNPEVEVSALTVGGRDGEANKAEFYIHLTPAKSRKLNTSQVKDKIRDQLKEIAFANPLVKDYDPVAGGQRPFNLNLISFNQAELEAYSAKIIERLKKDPRLKDVDTTLRPGKPEFQIQPDARRARELGVSTRTLGEELRTQVEGLVAAKLRQNGHEYDVRVRLEDDQRNLKDGFASTYVPNINGNLLRLSDVAKPVRAEGLASINRQDRGRLIQLSADITPGAGIGDVINDLRKDFASQGEYKLPSGMRFAFPGQGENFEELGSSIPVAMGFGVLFIFLVLASLYESFITPFTIMLALPLAFCGSMVALFVARESMNIFSMIGIIMLLGISTKNSILLVDYANQLIQEGLSRTDALVKAGMTRLRPILMTTMALIAGTTPVALGLNEASRQRTSMGVAIIGGLISSTLLTLVVVPAAFTYIDRFRIFARGLWQRKPASSESRRPKASAVARNADEVQPSPRLGTP
jgi:HAE1 family hydrophobic/amphiphilic exporter-1